jgi:formylglycine-generating enzyme required for sulfatase activity
VARWLADAQEVAARHPEHLRALEALRERGTASIDRDPGTDPAMDQVLHLRRVRGAAIAEGSRLPEGDPARSELAETARIAGARLARLEEGLASRPVYRFERPEDQWLHDRLARLVLEIEALTRGTGSDGTVASMTRRLGEGREIERKTIIDASAAWASAIAEIGDVKKCPHYGGLVIAPVFGLVPIGRDPGSGLHEFAHVPSGDPPVRDRDGRLVLTEESSIVLVLVPGGRTRMGARLPAAGAPSRDHADPHVRPPEEPVNEVALDPYFISKYEMTQGQWLRATGTNPSHHRPGRAWAAGYEPNLRHPVEQVSWEECEDVLRRLGLVLPTEAQWEHAARAGTTTPWWCGESEDAFLGLENLADRTGNAAQGLDRPDERRDDGWAGPAPVGTWPANPFGLHDVVGNVAEWCRDLIATYAEPALPGDGLRCGTIERLRAIRGGDYRTKPRMARSAFRYGGNAANRDAWTGVRPGLPVRKP